MNDIEKTRLIKEAHILLDKIERNIHGIVQDIRDKQMKKAA